MPSSETPPVSLWEAPYGDVMSGWGIHLAADVQELAAAQLQELLGTEKGAHGHQPARADIQKLKDLYELSSKAQPGNPGSTHTDVDSIVAEHDASAREWNELTQLTPDEEKAFKTYRWAFGDGHGRTASDAFEIAVELLSEPSPAHGDLQPFTPEEAQKILGMALKKQERSHSPSLYMTIKETLTELSEREPESYKLWPWIVKQIKEEFKKDLANSTTGLAKPGQFFRMGISRHMADVVAEAGPVLNKLRQENRLPQNFDLNQMDFQDLADWLMLWKKENRASESQGEVVYTFHNGWTMQKLTTPEQLQFEGDSLSHCVGSYSGPVGEGRTIIYSLRDPKGNPHATIEVEAIDSYNDLDGTPNAVYVHPDEHEPGQHFIQGTREVTGKGTPFEIVQVMGNGNTQPKPEYQRKIKEFLDSLRAKGWSFKRSQGWHRPYDGDDEGPEYHEIHGEGDLEDWWDQYQQHHNQFQGRHEDAYGMPLQQADVSMADLDDMLENVLESSRSHYDGHYAIGDWEQKAQQIYHAYWMENGSGSSHGKLVQNALDDIQTVEQKIYEQIDQWYFDNEQYLRLQIEEKYEELGGEYEEDEAEEAEAEEAGEWSNPSPSHYEAHGKTPLDEEKWEEAATQVRDDVYDDQLGDATKFLNYLHHLFDRGFVAREDLPHPGETNAGLPSYQELIDHVNWRNTGEGKPLDMPGTFSSWRPHTAANEFCNKCGSQNISVTPTSPTQSEGRCNNCGETWQTTHMSPEQMHEELGRQLPSLFNHYPDDMPGDLTVPDDWRLASLPITVHPIDQEHNIWFDEDGNQRPRYRPGWAKNENGKMEQSGELEDTFLDRQGRQGQGVVAYHAGKPIGSLTYVEDPNGWYMLGTAYVHPDYRQNGVFSQMIQPIRDSGRPIDAYVWNAGWLKDKVRGWQQS